jgi:hypothetical protein
MKVFFFKVFLPSSSFLHLLLSSFFFIPLIDHIISNNPKRETHTDVLPCSNVSDHDAPYTCFNIRTESFEPHFKYVRKNEFIQDFESLPFNII